ncbi:AI-2E family transporter [Rhodobacterales bacterium 52_120_T64]|nr:AI-2E family transporter [Rhodobacterales bacterium 52_120_T64]
MSLSVGQQARWWGGGFIAFLLFLWLVNDAIAPFILGTAFAYLLDPVADKLESWGMGRTWATVLISLIALIVMLLALVLVVPLIFRQVSSLIETSPQLVSSLLEFLAAKFPSLLEEDSSVRLALSSFEDTLRSKGVALANTVLATSIAAVSSVLSIFVSLVVAFYLLLDWDRMTAVVDGWMPRQHVNVIRKLAREFDAVLAGFVRGQMTVGAILGVFYAVALAAVGLQFGVVVGLLAGALTFIPYVGSTVGGTVSIGLAIYQFWDNPVWIAVVAAIFIAGQAVEGNFLTPKLVGSSVGLHPVWLMFALYAFGSLIGFTGLLIAVPAAACIGVLGRFGIKNYRDSKLYIGPQDDSVGE